MAGSLRRQVGDHGAEGKMGAKTSQTTHDLVVFIVHRVNRNLRWLS